jgi:hypothetical protein
MTVQAARMCQNAVDLHEKRFAFAAADPGLRLRENRAARKTEDKEDDAQRMRTFHSHG